MRKWNRSKVVCLRDDDDDDDDDDCTSKSTSADDVRFIKFASQSKLNASTIVKQTAQPVMSADTCAKECATLPCCSSFSVSFRKGHCLLNSAEIGVEVVVEEEFDANYEIWQKVLVN